MTDHPSHINEVPEAQSAIQAKCFHPSGGFAEFTQEEIEQSISNRFEKIALLHANRIAVKSGNQSVTYDELNRIANRIAQALLLRFGMGEERIALLLDHDVPLVAAILGVLKAGKVFVVLDPSFPKARMAYMLANSQAGAVLCSSRNRSLARELEPDTSRLMNIDELDVGLSVENALLIVQPERLSYIVYTSGSTGRPKGVMQTHRNSLHEAMVYGNGLRISMHDRMALLYSCSASQGLKIVFAALLNGAALYLFDLKKGGFNLLADWLARERITIYCSIPIVFRELASVLDAQHVFPNLRIIQLGSDAVRLKEIEDYRRHFSASAILIIRFGSSEAGTLSRFFVDGDTPLVYRGVRVGYAVEGTQILLLDTVDSGKAAGANEPGEIAARSRYLSPGYWQLPKLTEARFQPAPNDDERIYLTGDLGRTLPDGSRFDTMTRAERCTPCALPASRTVDWTITSCSASCAPRARELTCKRSCAARHQAGSQRFFTTSPVCSPMHACRASTRRLRCRTLIDFAVAIPSSRCVKTSSSRSSMMCVPALSGDNRCKRRGDRTFSFRASICIIRLTRMP
jgi:non-ribosomal peptide synthetase component F